MRLLALGRSHLQAQTNRLTAAPTAALDIRFLQLLEASVLPERHRRGRRTAAERGAGRTAAAGDQWVLPNTTGLSTASRATNTTSSAWPTIHGRSTSCCPPPTCRAAQRNTRSPCWVPCARPRLPIWHVQSPAPSASEAYILVHSAHFKEAIEHYGRTTQSAFWYAQAGRTRTNKLSENPCLVVSVYFPIPTGFVAQKIGPVLALHDDE